MRFFRHIPSSLKVSTFVAGLAALGACDLMVEPVPVPPARPASVAKPAPKVPTASVESRNLAVYYARVQNDLQTQGLLRQDGGGPDTPFRAGQLAQNFEQIAFFDEYTRGTGLRGTRGGQSGLRRWAGPVRIGIEFGASVPDNIRARDTATVRNYAARLARVTRHPISASQSAANFHVLVVSEDDRASIVPQIQRIVPNIDAGSLDVFRNIPRSIHCLVAAFAGSGSDHTYTTAIAIVRAEHPDLLRTSCLHEEIAQGLGLANDSPAARPSIFNDDDEFALLTSHDEMLLRMLYDPRLSPGMTAEAARPITRIIANELTGNAI